jgi:hypothetical protein
LSLDKNLLIHTLIVKIEAGEGRNKDIIGDHRYTYLQDQNKKDNLRVELGDKKR